MSYTVLRVTADGVPFRAHHARRIAAGGEDARAAFEAFCAVAAPGIYALRFEGGALSAEPRTHSRLWAGIPVGYAVSPFTNRVGRFAKPPPPSPYAKVRTEGIATLLTDREGEEIFEACSAAVIAWTGERWVMPPPDRPRVASVAEAALEEAGLLTPAPIRVALRQPLLLLNAVIGACTVAPSPCALPPPAAIALVERALRAASGR